MMMMMMMMMMMIIIIITVIEFSLGGSKIYTSTDKTNKNKYVYMNETIQKTRYKQHKTQ